MGNNEESCGCVICDSVEHFRQMFKDGVAWENALRFVLEEAIGTAVGAVDEAVSDAIQESFHEGFELGVEVILEKTQETVDVLTEDSLAVLDELRAMRDSDDDDEIEDLTDEQFDEIQKRLLEDM